MGTLSETKTRFQQNGYLNKYMVSCMPNEILLDLDEDSVPDIVLIDDDNDGDLDTIAVDLTGDGEFNLYLIDFDKNGTTDAVVYQESGECDLEDLGIGEDTEQKLIKMSEKAYGEIMTEDFNPENIKKYLLDIENKAKEARKQIK